MESRSIALGLEAIGNNFWMWFFVVGEKIRNLGGYIRCFGCIRERFFFNRNNKKI